jgi:predicted HD phosphohydrolase
MAASERIDRIFEAMRSGSEMTYGERVTILEHSVQAALFAIQDGADDWMVAAAFLHDYGHFVHDLGEDIADQGIDAVHEEIGAQALQDFFIPEVIEPMRLHVAAKRYLVATDASYRAEITPASIQSLALQGGPFNKAEIAAFEANPYFERAVQLRRYDEAGKLPDMDIPDLEYFRPYLEKSLKR